MNGPCQNGTGRDNQPIMRRFETTEDKKFWQFELEGNEALVEWGKIGGTGKQRQHKKFASETVAKSELAKLVAKKEQEGFVEVGKATGAPAPTPTPKATPTPAIEMGGSAPQAPEMLRLESLRYAPRFSIEPRIVWTDELKSRAAGERDEPVLDLAAGKSVWLKELAAHFDGPNKDRKTRFVKGLESSGVTPTCRAWAERMLASYAVGKEPKELDAAADAAVFVDGPFNPLVSYLLTRGGIAHLAKVMLAVANIERTWLGNNDAQYFVENTTSTLYRGSPANQIASVIRMRLAAAPAKERDEAQSIIESAHGTVRFALRIVCARALGRSDWAAADATDYLGSKRTDVAYDYPQQLFDVVRDPEVVTRLAKRYPQSVLAAVLMEDMGLAAEAAVIARHDKDPNSEWVAEALAAIESVPAAKQLAESLSKKRAAPVAKAYYERRPDLAVAALEPIVKNDAKLSPFAKPVLEAILRQHPELGGSTPAKPVAKVAAQSDVPAALAKPPELRKPVTLDSWQAGLPQVLLENGKALPDVAVTNLLLLLHQAPLNTQVPNAALAEVKRTCSRESLAAFAWALFENWLGVGGSSKEGWAFAAMGHLGDDECARKLAPLVRAWPGESQHARAVAGLDVLGAIGTDVALMHLHGIAQKVKFKGLQEKARLKMDALAKARGLTAEELADRLVPDSSGSTRRGRCRSTSARARSPSVSTKSSSPTCSTHPERASGTCPSRTRATTPRKPKRLPSASRRSRRTLAPSRPCRSSASRLRCAPKGGGRRATSNRSSSITRSSCTSRAGSSGPARRMLPSPFGVSARKRASLFVSPRIRSYVSADDRAVVLPKGASVGLVHRLDLDAKTIAAWGDHFGRYELLQPFDQLGRALFTIEDKEKKSATLDRTKGMKVKTGKVLGLEARGWRKGAAQDAGWVWDMEKTIGGFELTLPLGGGLCMGWHEGTPSEQELGAVGISGKEEKKSKATFGMLSPVVFSEFVRELEMLKDA